MYINIWEIRTEILSEIKIKIVYYAFIAKINNRKIDKISKLCGEILNIIVRFCRSVSSEDVS